MRRLGLNIDSMRAFDGKILPLLAGPACTTTEFGSFCRKCPARRFIRPWWSLDRFIERLDLRRQATRSSMTCPVISTLPAVFLPTVPRHRHAHSISIDRVEWRKRSLVSAGAAHGYGCQYTTQLNLVETTCSRHFVNWGMRKRQIILPFPHRDPRYVKPKTDKRVPFP